MDKYDIENLLRVKNNLGVIRPTLKDNQNETIIWDAYITLGELLHKYKDG